MGANATVARIWRGWTTIENADAYEAVVDGEVLPVIFARSIPGLVGAPAAGRQGRRRRSRIHDDHVVRES